jgi:hypothetical protein
MRRLPAPALRKSRNPHRNFVTDFVTRLLNFVTRTKPPRLQLERARIAGETLAALGLPALVLNEQGKVLAALAAAALGFDFRAVTSHGFYQASSKQVRILETFIAAERFLAWIKLQFERGNDGTCYGNS